jgi:2-polyprenyl-6-methoxyphenol hydroxylase-like FAD-dependent oxidoreductase
VVGMDAHVAGGGIGGLATAVGLTQAGWRVRVSERAPALSSDGTGLLLWPDVLRALDALGLGERLRRLAVPQPPGTLRRDDGRVLARVDPERVRRRVGDVPHVVARPDLLSVLFEALPEATVRFGVTAPVEPDADVLVGADGARSAVRRRLLGVRYGLRETGTTAWRVVVDAPTSTAGEVWGRDAKVGYTPLRGGRTYFYAVLPTRERRPDGDDHAVLLDWFGRWPEPVPSLLRQADPARLLRHPLHRLAPRLPRYVGARTALVGDAAHTMTPDLGQGACQALLDAVTLARCLTGVSGSEDVAAALRDYDRARRRPSQRIAAAALWTGRISTARHGAGVRDLLVRAAAALAG